MTNQTTEPASELEYLRRRNEELNRPVYGTELIALQAHREAIEAQRKAIEFEAWEYRERYVPMLKEEIAKRDAALKACVDWMIGNATHQAGCGLYGSLGKCSCGLDSAITQAKGAQG